MFINIFINILYIATLYKYLFVFSWIQSGDYVHKSNSIHSEYSRVNLKLFNSLNFLGTFFT